MENWVRPSQISLGFKLLDVPRIPRFTPAARAPQLHRGDSSIGFRQATPDSAPVALKLRSGPLNAVTEQRIGRLQPTRNEEYGAQIPRKGLRRRPEGGHQIVAHDVRRALRVEVEGLA